MPDTGYDWGAVAHATYNSGTDFDGVAIADTGSEVTDVISNDVKAATEVGVVAVEDNTGACDGDLTISILAPDHDPDSEGFQDTNDKVTQFMITPAQNTTRRLTFLVMHSKFKVHVENQAGQELVVSVNYRQATIPAAS